MAEFPQRLHRPLQIPQYNTTCTLNYLVNIPHYSFTKFIALFMFYKALTASYAITTKYLQKNGINNGYKQPNRYTLIYIAVY